MENERPTTRDELLREIGRRDATIRDIQRERDALLRVFQCESPETQEILSVAVSLLDHPDERVRKLLKNCADQGERILRLREANDHANVRCAECQVANGKLEAENAQLRTRVNDLDLQVKGLLETRRELRAQVDVRSRMRDDALGQVLSLREELQATHTKHRAELMQLGRVLRPVMALIERGVGQTRSRVHPVNECSDTYVLGDVLHADDRKHGCTCSMWTAQHPMHAPSCPAAKLSSDANSVELHIDSRKVAESAMPSRVCTCRPVDITNHDTAGGRVFRHQRGCPARLVNEQCQEPKPAQAVEEARSSIELQGVESETALLDALLTDPRTTLLIGADESARILAAWRRVREWANFRVTLERPSTASAVDYANRHTS
jgi:hypothetical protein